MKRVSTTRTAPDRWMSDSGALNRGGGEGAGRPQGFVLVAILVIVMLLSMLVVSLLFRFKAEDTASSASLGTEQAWAAAMSGIQEAVRVATAATAGSTEWMNNPRALRDRLVFEDGEDRWYFTVWSPVSSEETGPVAFGLSDEASRLNLNTANAEALSKLPGMTPAMGQALKDYVDVDDVPQPEGAEQDYYSGLPVPYAVRNGTLNTLEELRLVRGFSASVVAGEDANLNGRLDPNEDDGDERLPADNKDGRLSLGLRQYLSVSSYDTNETREGVRRVNVNDPNDPLPVAELPAALTNYIIALRSSGGRIAHPSELLEATLKLKDPNGLEVETVSGVGKAELGMVLDLFRASPMDRVEGLINVNTASTGVLVTIPGVDEPLAEAIVSTRRAIDAERRTTTAWLYQEGLVDAERFKRIAPFLTARSFQYRFLVIGYGLPLGRFRALEVGIDVKRAPNRVTYIRDITKLGLPFPLGGEPEDTTTTGSFHGSYLRSGGGGKAGKARFGRLSGRERPPAVNMRKEHHG